VICLVAQLVAFRCVQYHDGSDNVSPSQVFYFKLVEVL
jgi:hypothetical protein